MPPNPSIQDFIEKKRAADAYDSRGSALGGGSIGPRTPEVPMQLQTLADNVAKLGDALNVLLNRIGPVRRMPVPVNEANQFSAPKAVSDPLQTPLAIELQVIRFDVQRFRDRLEEALNDLELP